MPILKAQHAQPLVKDAIVLDLSDLRRQGQRMIETAKQEAQRIVNEARQRARVAEVAAKEHAHEQGLAQGREQGMVEGRKAGELAAKQAMQQRLERLDRAWTDAAATIEAHHEQTVAYARTAVVELAVQLAEMVLHRALACEPQRVMDAVTAAVSTVLEPRDVTLLIHPDDRALVEQGLPGLHARIQTLERVRLIEDEQVERGGCVVHSRQGEVDARITQQLRRVVELLLPERGGES